MIELKNIHKSFNDTEVIKGIDLTVDKGEVVTLIGRSGSGKTTLLRMMNALEIPTQGSVFVNGKTYTEKDKKSQIEVRQQSGMVFQSYNLFPHKSALENVMEGLVTVKKMQKAEAKSKAMELLEKVGLVHVKDQRPHALSGGQQQRVAIARALAMNPKVMLFDEPTSALDPISTLKVEELVQELKQKYSIIMVTHNMQQAARISDKTAFFLNGYVNEYDDTDKLFSNPSDKQTEDYISGRFG